MAATAPFESYIICGTPRTGSTLLCKLLAATGQAGQPDSYFACQFMGAWRTEWQLAGTTDSEYLAAAIAAGKGGTQIFGLRLMRESLDGLSQLLGRLYPDLTTDRARISRAFGQTLYIHQSRRDRLAQAISYVKAQQTGLWHVAPDGSELERLSPHQEPRYDLDAIRREVLAIEAHDEGWNAWFVAEGIEPLRVTYEALAAAPETTLGRICEALGIAGPKCVAPGVAILADDTNRDWATRYRRERE